VSLARMSHLLGDQEKKSEGYEKRLLTSILAPERENMCKGREVKSQGQALCRYTFHSATVIWKKSVSTDAPGSAGVPEDFCMFRVVTPRSQS